MLFRSYKAIEQLQLYLEYYPQSERAEEAQNISHVELAGSKGILGIADESAIEPDDNVKSAQTTIFIKRCVLAKKVFVIFWALNGIYYLWR